MKTRSIEVLIDAGSSAVRVAIAKISSHTELEILGVGCVEGGGFRRGVVVDMDKLSDGLERAIDEAERDAGLKINSAWFSISGEIMALNNVARIPIRQRCISAEDIVQLQSEACAIAHQNRYQLIHALRRRYCVDEHDGIMQPRGMIADQLGISVHIIQALAADVGNLHLCSERVGIDVSGFMFAGVAASKAVSVEDERQLGCCVADIGAGTINFVAWQQGQPCFSGTLPVGGEYASSDLAQLLKMPRPYAETLKCAKGSARRSDDNGYVSVSSTGLRGQKQIPRAEINEILRQRYREMLTMLTQELHRGGCLRHLHGGLVLTGGAARLPGLAAFAEDVTNLPVRIARPGAMPGLEQGDEEHCFAVILGMAALLAEPHEDGVWARPEKQGIITRLKSFFQ